MTHYPDIVLSRERRNDNNYEIHMLENNSIYLEFKIILERLKNKLKTIDYDKFRVLRMCLPDYLSLG